MGISAYEVANWLNENKDRVVLVTDGTNRVKYEISRFQEMRQDDAILIFAEEVHDYSGPGLCCEIESPTEMKECLLPTPEKQNWTDLI